MPQLKLFALLRFLRTIRHLKPSQLFWRLRYALERRTKPQVGSWPEEVGSSLRDDFPELPPIQPSGPSGTALVERLEKGVFEHLGRAVEIGRENPHWHLGEVRRERLWVITLHYHGWAFALAQATSATSAAADLFCHYIDDWITRCAPQRAGTPALAWNSYAIATRLGWWIRSYRLASCRIFAPQPQLKERFLSSIWQQAEHLARHLEWDLRGNHLLRDAVGLAMAGRFFRHPAAEAWLQTATRLASDQVAEQVLDDGGHFERSPKYHIDVMEDILLLFNLVEDPEVRRTLRERWAEMARFLTWTCHPDGQIARLNDGVPGAACPPQRMLDHGRLIDQPIPPPPSGGRHFPETGLVVWHGKAWSVFFDVGPLGPDYQPGHGHADTLTVEVSFRGCRLVVDPGTYGYDDDDRRCYDRSTASHNTVCIDDRDSSEVWHIFRVGRRARPQDVNVEIGSEAMTAQAGHDGYAHMLGSPLHRRSLHIREPDEIEVVDRIEGGGRHKASCGLLIEPSWKASPRAGGWNLVNGDRRVLVRVSSPVRLDLFAEPRPYHPEIGQECQVLRVGWRWSGKPPLEVRVLLRGK
ncbi:MAG TPA: alginate lyase family protein [Acidobacteriota bacterium]|nr:alginate lyase family protein [Acidobacteriota bacterium]